MATLAAVACAREPFVLLSSDLGSATGARLNQPLILAFSAELEPGSRSEESLRVVRVRDDQPVAGNWRIEGATATFLPCPPTTIDLADVAFAPGESLRLEIRGLPSFAALRGASAGPLERGAAIDFHALVVAGDWRTRSGAELFIDPVPGPPELLERSITLVDGHATLRFSEPLDPRALAKARFWLCGAWSRAGHPTDNPLLQARLVRNRDRAEVELAVTVDAPPPSPLRAGDACDLLLEPEALCDLVGQPLAQNGMKSDAYVHLVITP